MHYNKFQAATNQVEKIIGNDIDTNVIKNWKDIEISNLKFKYNKENGITPQTIRKSVRDVIKATIVEDVQAEYEIGKDESVEDIINKLKRHKFSIHAFL